MWGRLSNFPQAHIILKAEGNKGDLWLGDYFSATDLNFLQSKNIKTVLTVASNLGVSYPKSTTNIHHVVYSLFDVESANISRFFTDSFYQIDQGLQKGSVLVHCAAGISRSSTIVIAYMMRKFGWDFSKCLNFVREKRSIVCPNFGFQRQLRQFEKELEAEKEEQKKAKVVEKSLNIRGEGMLMTSSNIKSDLVNPQLAKLTNFHNNLTEKKPFQEQTSEIIKNEKVELKSRGDYKMSQSVGVNKRSQNTPENQIQKAFQAGITNMNYQSTYKATYSQSGSNQMNSFNEKKSNNQLLNQINFQKYFQARK